ncbi:hydrogenase maturation protease [Mycolicibacterium hodleri]|uniref:Hydrogenase maturation protease n=1 Tax=Mycolicibacterium hodleri TaxID=49897 RepID=A0A502E767_9MYCO|nr:hydrogenase maturation protease [Mycolicibacterium hodleri]TPG32692.1 hydrogenase maturation protease [Mycolicibacterium hodleri]
MSASAEPLFLTLDHFDDPSSLIYGIGNVGRQDDGLGWAFIDELEAHQHFAQADLRCTYQLNLEDADLINGFAKVLFVDATKDPAVTSFALTRPEPRLDFSFTSHALSVPSVLATAKQCFGRVPEVHLLAIRGHEWELQMGLTESARQNLGEALTFLSTTSSTRR